LEYKNAKNAWMECIITITKSMLGLKKCV